MSITKQIQNCPVEVALEIIGKKWSIHIIRDMLRGITRFSDFLELNPKLTTKMLSLRLRELCDYGLIERIVVNKIPTKIEYHLTEIGLALNEIIIALSKFSITKYPARVFNKVTITKLDTSMAVEEAKNRFSVISSVDDYALV